MAEATATFQPPPTRVSRLYHAPRSLVFRAWSSTEHVKRWFTPAGLGTPFAKVELRVGGAFEVCMRMPDGAEHWVRGTFVEVTPIERLVIDMYAEDAQGHRFFRAMTEVNFVDDLGTRVDVVQTYTVFDPAAAQMIGGAEQGWASTMDNLGEEIRRMLQPDFGTRSVVHATFHLERTYDAPASRVFKAFADPQAKAKWFGGDADQWTPLERHMDFRVGGRERAKGRWGGGVVSCFDAVYHDIVPDERIVYTYEMYLDDVKISVSLATVEIKLASDGRTTLTITEQGVFLDGYDDAGSREQGTNFLMDKLGASLRD